MLISVVFSIYSNILFCQWNPNTCTFCTDYSDFTDAIEIGEELNLNKTAFDNSTQVKESFFENQGIECSCYIIIK